MVVAIPCMIRNGPYLWQGDPRTLTDNTRAIVDRIERAHSSRPYCACGRHTTPIYRDGAVWLDCSVLLEPIDGRLRRWVGRLGEPKHVHAWISDVPPPVELEAAA